MMMLTMMMVPPPEIRFNSRCPICKGEMAEGNRFCSLKCYNTNKYTEKILKK